jgi:predicted transcriptional regulator
MANETERTLTVRVGTRADFFAEAMEAARRVEAGGGYQGEVRSFASLPLLLSVFSEKRWKLIIELQKLGPSTLRGLARALGRDVKRVHEDANMLLDEGIIARDDNKRLFVPFKKMRLEADLFDDDATKAA